jgi:hypothetical protein
MQKTLAVLATVGALASRRDDRGGRARTGASPRDRPGPRVRPRGGRACCRRLRRVRALLWIRIRSRLRLLRSPLLRIGLLWRALRLLRRTVLSAPLLPTLVTDQKKPGARSGLFLIGVRHDQNGLTARRAGSE